MAGSSIGGANVDELAQCGVKLVASLHDNWIAGLIGRQSAATRVRRTPRGIDDASGAKLERTLSELIKEARSLACRKSVA